jgi:hypothetical protein
MLLVAVLGFWWLQWQFAPAGGGPDGAAAATFKAHAHDDDD